MINMPTLVVIAGGLAKRLHPITKAIPKSLVEVKGVPFIDHQLRMLSQKGLTRIVFCIGHYGDQIKKHLANSNTHGIEILFSEDGDTLRHTGGALLKALPYLDEEFLVTYGDSYLDADYQGIARHFHNSSLLAMMTVYKNDKLWDNSNVLFEDGKIQIYSKADPHPAMQHIDFGLLAFRKKCFQPWMGIEKIDLADILEKLVQTEGLGGFEVLKRFYEVGTTQGIDDLEAYFDKQSKK